MSLPHFPSEIRFGAFLVYPSPARTPEARHAKDLILALKQDRYTTLQPPQTVVSAIVRVLKQDLESSGLHVILTPDATVVPVPKSAPMLKGGVWPSRSICEALVAASLAREWRPLVTRTMACEKAAYCAPSDRPTPRRHYDTMTAIPTTLMPSRIVLVDDVVTKGATLAGAAARLLEQYPHAEITAFAIARTCDFFTTLQEPCLGDIHVAPDGTGAYRRDVI